MREAGERQFSEPFLLEELRPLRIPPPSQRNLHGNAVGVASADLGALELHKFSRKHIQQVAERLK